jgi:hypothetical protein
MTPKRGQHNKKGGASGGIPPVIQIRLREKQSSPAKKGIGRDGPEYVVEEIQRKKISTIAEASCEDDYPAHDDEDELSDCNEDWCVL